MDGSEDLRTAYANYAERLKDISANPKATYKIDNQEFRWNEYQEMLLKNMKALRDEINATDDNAFTSEETILYVDPPFGISGPL